MMAGTSWRPWEGTEWMVKVIFRIMVGEERGIKDSIQV